MFSKRNRASVVNSVAVVGVRNGLLLGKKQRSCVNVFTKEAKMCIIKENKYSFVQKKRSTFRGAKAFEAIIKFCLQAGKGGMRRLTSDHIPL